MITRNELISSKEYWLVKFQSALYEQVEKYLSENKISKTDFAKKLGVSKGYISQILNGDFDHKISKLIELSLAIEKAPLLKFENLGEYILPDSPDFHSTLVESQELGKVIKQPKAGMDKNPLIGKDTVRKITVRKVGVKKHAAQHTEG